MLAPVTTPVFTEDDLYDAFARRDRTFRALCVGAVKTTGIYCRAGCPARLPKRQNVTFYDTAEEARAAGYRACLRCKPDELAPDAALIERMCRMIEEAEVAPSLDDLAAAAKLSPFHFHRLFKARTGVTPGAYAAQVKDRRAKAALAGGATVTEAIYEAGYGASSRFYAGAEQRLGMAPRRYRQKGAGQAIRIAVAPCGLGHVLVAATNKGLAAVELGDDPQRLAADFRARFEKAEISDDGDLKALVEAVVSLIDHPADSQALPLDVQGTAFQRRVWDVLRRIPAGQTWTYAQVAAAIGQPKAVRAVGGACNRNPVAVVVPCHRVVGSSGAMTGYRWGVDKKEALLAKEMG